MNTTIAHTRPIPAKTKEHSWHSNKEKSVHPPFLTTPTTNPTHNLLPRRMSTSILTELQKHLVQLVQDQAYRSAEILAQGLLIEAPATTSLASSSNQPLVGPGSPVQTLVILGEALSKAGEYKRSIAIYKQAQQLVNRNHRRRSSKTTKTATTTTAEVYMHLCKEMGYCWGKIGNTRAAIEALQGIEDDQRSVSVQLMLGQLHRALGQKALAKQCYASVWQRNPFALEAAHALIDLGEKAETLLEQCRGAHTSCAPWIPTVIQAYSYEHHFAPKEALKCLESLGAAFDASLNVLLQKGRLNLHLNKINQAIQLYERAHRLDSANVVGMDLYALCLYETRNKEALNSLAQSLLVNGGTKRPEPWIVAALHCLVVNKDDKALSMIEQACQAGPQHSMSFYVKGMILLKKEDPEPSTNDPVRWFRAAKMLSPSIRTFSMMVESFVKAGQFKQAYDTAKKIRDLMPDDARPYVLLGTVQAAKEDDERENDKAKKNFVRALEVDPQCMIAVYRLADLYFTSGSYQDAIIVLERALQYCSYTEDSDQLHYRLGNNYFELHEIDDATEQYQSCSGECEEAKEGLEKIQNPEQDESMENVEDMSEDESGEF